MPLVARHGAGSDVGRHRENNEDAFVAAPPLYAVCDGMGGAAAGEVASELAARTLAEAVAAGHPLAEAVALANRAVHERAGARRELAGMGSTLTAMLVRGERAELAHVGDSRAYLLRDGVLRQLTEDHSLVGELVREGRLSAGDAAGHPYRNVLTRVLGTDEAVAVDRLETDLRAGDVVLLCTDGLTGMVGDDDIARLLAAPDPQQAADDLVAAALAAGGLDNVTVVVVRFEEAEPAAGEGEAGAAGAGAPREASPATAAPGPQAGPGAASQPVAAVAGGRRGEEGERRRLRRLALALLALTLLFAAAAVLLSSVYFIDVEDGRLVVCSGLPLEVGPLPLHAVYRRSVRTYDSLDAAQRALVDRRELMSRAAALALAAELGMWP